MGRVESRICHRQFQQLCRDRHSWDGDHGGLALILALVACIIAFGARRSVALLQTRLAGVLDELRTLQTLIALSRGTAS